MIQDEQEKYLQELSAWQARERELVSRIGERGREAGALEAEQARTIAALVDTPAGERREELIYTWRELRDAREIVEGEREELSRRLTVLRSRPPRQLSTNGSRSTSLW